MPPTSKSNSNIRKPVADDVGDDALRFEAVRLALRGGDIAEASKYGRVFELTPVSAK